MAKSKTLTSDIIKLVDWRFSFLNITTPKSFKPGQDARYEATFLADPTRTDHMTQMKALKAAAQALCTEKGWNYDDLTYDDLAYGMADKHPKKKKYDGYAGMFYIVTANKDQPTICGRNLEPLTPAKKPYPYSGARGNTNVTLWTQDNEFGQAIRANLRIIQFTADDAPFGAGAARPEDEFQALGDAPKTGKKAAVEDDDIPF